MYTLKFWIDNGIVVAVLILFCPIVYSSVSRNDFFRTDPSVGGSGLPPQDDGFAQIQLLYNFKFFNQSYTSAFVDTNGLISFGQGVSTYTPTCDSGNISLIAAFFADVDIRYAGNVTYLETANPSYLNAAAQQIRNGLGIGELTLQSAFIVSYMDVPFFGEFHVCNISNLINTFQVMITSDGVRSFAIFNYETIVWTTGTASGGNCTGTGGASARAGFDLGIGLGATFKTFGGSCTDDIINIENYSNVNIPGKFIFELDDNFQTVPCQGISENAHVPVTPSFVPVWGHLPISIKGPCTANISSVTCSFDLYQSHDRLTHPAAITSDDSISCIVPYLDSVYTNVPPIVIITRTDSSVEFYFGHMFPIEPYTDMRVVINQVSSGVASGTVGWGTQKFGDSSVSLDLVLLEFKDKRWTEVGIGLSGIPNTGFYFGDISVGSVNDSNVYAFRLTPNPVGILNPTELTVAGHKPSSFSDMQYLGTRDRDANIAACEDWYNNDPGPPTDTLSCPPFVSMAFVDERFAQMLSYEVSAYHPGADYCFRQRTPSPSSGDQSCCYKNGQILFSGCGAGSACPIGRGSVFGVPNYFETCVIPKLKCCTYAADAAGVPDSISRKLFYTRRPPDDGADYSPPASASSGGEPHFVTFDGFAYTFNGYGEYILIASEILNMQGRMSPYIFPNGTQALATVFKAFVICQASSTPNNRTCLQISVNPPDGVLIYVDGQILSYTLDQLPLTFTANGMSLTIESAARFSLSFSSGFSFIITTADSNQMLNLIAQATPGSPLYGQVDGLLGHFDGSQTNDLRSSSGATIPTSSSTQTIHYQFGESWRINSTTTIFTYPNGFTWANFQNPNYVPIFTSPSGTPPQEIIDMCAGNQNCLYDWGVTGNAGLANDTKKADEEFTSSRTALAQPIVMCSALSDPAHGQVSVDNYLLGSSATYSCNSGYTLCGHSTRTCQKIGGNPPSWSHKKPCCDTNFLCLGWLNLGCLPLLKPLGLLTCCACD